MEKELRVLYSLVEERLGVNEDVLKSKVKTTEVVDARRIVSGVLLKNTGMNLESIGEAVGRDHSNISHYKATTDGIIETDKKFRINFNHVNTRFKIATDGRTLEEKLEELIYERDKLNMEIEVTEEEIKKYKKIKSCV